MLTLKELAAEVRSYRNVVITTHVSPDADAVGSSCGLHFGLLELGIASVVYLSESVPEYVAPLVGNANITCEIPAHEVDALIVVDTAASKRITGKLEASQIRTKKVLNIDHHASNDAWGTLNYIRPEAPSASILVFTLLEELGADIKPHTANLLLAGLVDDTGSFRFSNASQESFEVAARMVGRGASPSKVATDLYFSVPERVLRLRALGLAAMKFFSSGRIACVPVTKQMLAESGAKPEDSEGIVDFARSVRGTVAAVLIRELDDGWKVSLRSKETWLDVNAVAGTFGGGGHKAAAGCKLTGSYPEVERQIIERLSAVVQDH